MSAGVPGAGPLWRETRSGLAASALGGSGLLRVDKPGGVTSHDVVDRVRRRFKVKGAGHLGTLDPAASGLLVLALGAATRCARIWQAGCKTYEGVVRFGVVTGTQDLQGEVLERHEVALSESEVRAATLGFVGEIEQVPPMVSALKVGGRRLYKLARRGEEVERAPRRVTVHSWEWLGMALPEARFRVVVSSGTYVRTLAHDLGQKFGCGAHLCALRRTAIDRFRIDAALPLEEIEKLPVSEIEKRLLPVYEVVPSFVA